ncbi:MAG: ASCH domain-containing protein [Ancrocorticia sp.]|jgi:uncharacterized protein YhfF|nr:ASCH domain-containing protein [Ancrocorticia sp.]MCI1896015.1 ASCH domain-containing protein [Ancrocorticia sp.]MCI1932735.1 ASCH domain-containing protein [Ancrocorticia sp.]MCI1963823.1 ASCH domain-containing protein [Ancrocorticia sp.]MCI2002161.1 ASCH domain-containing protein [Ancrocorticia sp.]
MNDASEPPREPSDLDVEAFWIRARTVGRLNPLEVVVGQDDSSSLRPPTFSFGATREQADRLCQLVCDGVKTATSGWFDSFEREAIPLPRVGELAILCDGQGNPRALIRETAIRYIPFDDVGPDVAQAEGEGTFEEWLDTHEQFFRDECATLGLTFNPHGDVVVEYFETLYCAPDIPKR